MSSTMASSRSCRSARWRRIPLKFRDGKRYTDRLKTAKADTDLQDAVLVGEGYLEGQEVVAAAQDFRFMGGSLGMAAGEGVIVRHDARGREARALHPVCRLRRRAHAGGHPLAHADAAHHHCRADAARGAPALPRRAHRSHHRRRHRLLRHAGRRAHRRARRAHLLCRPARHPADHPRAATRGLPEGRVPAGARHGRHGRASPPAARDAGAAVPAAQRRHRSGAPEPRSTPPRTTAISTAARSSR